MFTNRRVATPSFASFLLEVMSDDLPPIYSLSRRIFLGWHVRRQLKLHVAALPSAKGHCQ